MKRFRLLASLLVVAMVLTAGVAWADSYADVKKAGKLMAMGKYDQAINMLNTAIACGQLTKEGLAIAYNYRGLAYLKKKCCQMACTDFSMAVKLVPGYGVAYYNRHLAFKCLDNMDAAKKDLAMFNTLKKKFGVAKGAPAKLKGKVYAGVCGGGCPGCNPCWEPLP